MTCKDITRTSFKLRKLRTVENEANPQESSPLLYTVSRSDYSPMERWQRERQLFSVFSFPAPINVISIVLWAAL